jgi:hypothetical protein
MPSTTELVAWYGAGLSTLVFATSLVRWWFERAKLEITTHPREHIMPSGTKLDGTPAVWVRVTNRGGSPITIVGFRIARQKPGYQFPIVWLLSTLLIDIRSFTFPESDEIESTKPLPHTLGPKEVWVGRILLNRRTKDVFPDITSLPRHIYYLGVVDAAGVRPRWTNLVLSWPF